MDSQVTDLFRHIIQRLDNIQQQQDLIQRRQSQLDQVVERLDSVQYSLDRQNHRQNFLNEKLCETNDKLDKVILCLKERFGSDQTDILTSVTDRRSQAFSDGESSHSPLNLTQMSEKTEAVSDLKVEEREKNIEIKVNSMPELVDTNLQTLAIRDDALPGLEVMNLQNTIHDHVQGTFSVTLACVEHHMKVLGSQILDIQTMLEDKASLDLAFTEDGIKGQLEDICYKMRKEIINKNETSMNRAVIEVKQELKATFAAMRSEFRDSLHYYLHDSMNKVNDHIEESKHYIFELTKKEIVQVKNSMEQILSMASTPFLVGVRF